MGAKSLGMPSAAGHAPVVRAGAVAGRRPGTAISVAWRSVLEEILLPAARDIGGVPEDLSKPAVTTAAKPQPFVEGNPAAPAVPRAEPSARREAAIPPAPLGPPGPSTEDHPSGRIARREPVRPCIRNIADTPRAGSAPSAADPRPSSTEHRTLTSRLSPASIPRVAREPAASAPALATAPGTASKVALLVPIASRDEATPQTKSARPSASAVPRSTADPETPQSSAGDAVERDTASRLEPARTAGRDPAPARSSGESALRPSETGGSHAVERSNPSRPVRSTTGPSAVEAPAARESARETPLDVVPPRAKDAAERGADAILEPARTAGRAPVPSRTSGEPVPRPTETGSPRIVEAAISGYTASDPAPARRAAAERPPTGSTHATERSNPSRPAPTATGPSATEALSARVSAKGAPLDAAPPGVRELAETAPAMTGRSLLGLAAQAKPQDPRSLQEDPGGEEDRGPLRIAESAIRDHAAVRAAIAGEVGRDLSGGPAEQSAHRQQASPPRAPAAGNVEASPRSEEAGSSTERSVPGARQGSPSTTKAAVLTQPPSATASLSSVQGARQAAPAVHAPEVAPVSHEALAQAIVARAREIPGDGRLEVRFVLEPADLGLVRVRIETRAKQVSIEILASSRSAVDALAPRLARLSADLLGAGFKEPTISLDFGSSTDPSAHARHHGQGGGRGASGSPRAPRGPLGDPVAAGAGPLAPSSRLDRTV